MTWKLVHPLIDFILSWKILKGNFFKVWNQCQHMLSLRDDIMMLCIPLSIDLTDYQGRISKYIQEFDSQVDSSFETHNACFIFSHIVGTVET